jgi:glycine betaine/proline transport system permease protein
VTAIRWGETTLPNPASSKRALLVVLGIAAVIAYILFNGQWTLPHDDDADIFRWLNGVKTFISDHREVLDPIRIGVTSLIDLFDEILASLGWPGVIGLVSALGLLFGGVRLALLSGIGFAFIGVLGLWDATMETLAILLAAVVIALLIGLPLGIAAGRSNRLNALLSPILDVMQIMPTMAYLAPITLLFLIGAPAAVVATLIYALPAAIRITTLGLRGVPHDTVEAASAFGASSMQTLRKVELPLARRAIALGINQTIMLSLSMVVIAGLIGAPGLAKNIVVALSKVDIGTAFEAGLAIVILAIVLDRLTDAAGEWLSPRARIARRRSGRPGWQRLIGPGIVLAIGLIAPVVVDATTFPEAVQVSLSEPVNAGLDWFTGTFSTATVGVQNAVTNVVLNPIESVLTSAPWWLMVAVVAVAAWAISGSRAALISAACLGLIILLNLWNHSMVTLANVLVATALTLVIGIALGIATARNTRLRSLLRPLLDAAQTMPAFVYLIPAVALFLPSRFTAIVAAVIFAVPPVIRLVEVGILSVPSDAVEAAASSGATDRQMLFKVQLPMSRRTLLLAANQGIVMVLSMVVIGALVGAGALGYDVITGFSRGEQFGKGLAAGVAIVLLGIMLDRITQGAGGRRRSTAARAG